eukprot:4213151-Pleurochrysis_carterae.AAC.1
MTLRGSVHCGRVGLCGCVSRCALLERVAPVFGGKSRPVTAVNLLVPYLYSTAGGGRQYRDGEMYDLVSCTKNFRLWPMVARPVIGIYHKSPRCKAF